jgi:branched-chain amino acid transport system ATP-binding protein
MSEDPILAVESVSVHFGGLTALRDVSIALRPREIHAIIGPNGAGKTTLLNVMAGRQRPDRGRVMLDGIDVTRWSSSRVARAGLSRTFQNVGLFHELTALENVLLGIAAKTPPRLTAGMLGLPGQRRRSRAYREGALELMRARGVHALRADTAGALSYGQQRMVEITRALAGEPRVLLLDEPAAGLNQTEKLALVAKFRALAMDNGLSLFLIDHNMRMVMAAADRVTVLDRGRVIASGRPDEVRRDERVIEAYLGRDA